MVWGSENSRQAALADGYIVAANKEEFFKSADIISLHLRLTESTRGIVTAIDLSLMKPDALLVNTSRAEQIAPGVLVEALKLGNPGYAAIDVYEDEPVFDKHYPLLTMPNVLCTPHLGYVEKNSYELYFSKSFENIVAFVEGRPTNIVNPR